MGLGSRDNSLIISIVYVRLEFKGDVWVRDINSGVINGYDFMIF